MYTVVAQIRRTSEDVQTFTFCIKVDKTLPQSSCSVFTKLIFTFAKNSKTLSKSCAAPVRYSKSYSLEPGFPFGYDIIVQNRSSSTTWNNLNSLWVLCSFLNMRNCWQHCCLATFWRLHRAIEYLDMFTTCNNNLDTSVRSSGEHDFVNTLYLIYILYCVFTMFRHYKIPVY